VRVRIVGVKPVDQLLHIAREIINIAAHMAAQRHHRALIAARRAAKPEIDTPRIERIQRTELLGNYQRSVVRQHHAARAETQGLRIRCQVTDQYRRRRAGDPGHVVVLRQPEAIVTALLRQLRQIEGMGKRVTRA